MESILAFRKILLSAMRTRALRKAEGIVKSYMSSILRLALLAPDIVEATRDGRAGQALNWTSLNGRCRLAAPGVLGALAERCPCLLTCIVVAANSRSSAGLVHMPVSSCQEIDSHPLIVALISTSRYLRDGG
jgi:hypothetical protein